MDVAVANNSNVSVLVNAGCLPRISGSTEFIEPVDGGRPERPKQPAQPPFVEDPKLRRYALVMAISQSFEGVRFSIKVDLQTLAHLEKEAAGSARERVARDWLNNWRTLAGLSPYLFQRLVYAAQKRRMPITSLVNEALTKYCTDLPPVPEGVQVRTTIDVLDEEEPKEEKPAEKATKSRK